MQAIEAKYLQVSREWIVSTITLSLMAVSVIVGVFGIFTDLTLALVGMAGLCGIMTIATSLSSFVKSLHPVLKVAVRGLALIVPGTAAYSFSWAVTHDIPLVMLISCETFFILLVLSSFAKKKGLKTF